MTRFRKTKEMSKMVILFYRPFSRRLVEVPQRRQTAAPSTDCEEEGPKDLQPTQSAEIPHELAAAKHVD